jgi:hypothetical protein
MVSHPVYRCLRLKRERFSAHGKTSGKDQRQLLKIGAKFRDLSIAPASRGTQCASDAY